MGIMKAVDGQSSVATVVTPEPMGNTSGGVQVLIAHADATCRELVARLVRDSGIGVVDAVPDGESAISAARRDAPALVLVGANLAGLSVAETTRRLTRASPASRVLVLGTGESERELGDTLGAGAAGYVRVDEPAERLDIAVKVAIALLGHQPRA
jgi:DNA-binding NarL/FixJ family response regulator